MIRKAVEKVERWIEDVGGQAGGRRRGRARRGTQGILRGEMLLDGAGNDEERGVEAGEGKEVEEDSWERWATRGPPRKRQLSYTKANLPGPFSGSQMTILADH